MNLKKSLSFLLALLMLLPLSTAAFAEEYAGTFTVKTVFFDSLGNTADNLSLKPGESVRADVFFTSTAGMCWVLCAPSPGREQLPPLLQACHSTSSTVRRRSSSSRLSGVRGPDRSGASLPSSVCEQEEGKHQPYRQASPRPQMRGTPPRRQYSPRRPWRTPRQR